MINSGEKLTADGNLLLEIVKRNMFVFHSIDRSLKVYLWSNM
jgi:hypothetical protein